MKAYAKWLICAGSGLLLVLIGVLINKWIVPVYLNSQIKQKMVLTPGSMVWTNFIEPPMPLTFKVYIFNVMNQNEVMSGGKPRLSQVGPYVYKQYMKKHNLVVDGKLGTVTYNQGYTFKFDSEASKPLSDSDIVHPINFLSQMVFLAFSKLGPGLNSLVEILDSVLPVVLGENNNFLLQVSVRQLLFEGVPFHCNNTEASMAVRLFCSVVNNLPAKNIVKTSDGNFLISLFNFKNMTTQEPMEINSGINSPLDVGKIVSFDGATNLSVWSGNYCNDISNSYDISVLPLFLSRSSAIRIFISDAGAPVNFVYDQDVNYKNIPGYRFIPSPEFLGEVTDFPYLNCFCPSQSQGLFMSDGCLRTGALDLSTVLTVPVIISRAHFYLASPLYQRGIDGLNPNPLDHSSFFDVEPLTGMPLQAASRIQVNVQMMRTSAGKMFQNLTPTLIPVVWFDQGVQVGSDLIKILQDNMMGLRKNSEIIMWVCVSVGSLFAVIGAIGLCMSLRRKR